MHSFFHSARNTLASFKDLCFREKCKVHKGQSPRGECMKNMLMMKQTAHGHKGIISKV